MTLADTFCVVCEEFNLVIWNGFLPGDEEGNYTYTAHNGSSVIDHFLLSRCLVHLGTSLAVIPNTESKHMPVELELELVGNNDVSVERQTKVKTQKYVWDANKAQDYFENFLFCFVLFYERSICAFYTGH